MNGVENDIIVTGSRRFQVAVDRLLGVEGGHVNDPVDRGGETKYGISLRFLVSEGQFDLDGDGFADFDLDMDGDIDGADIRKLTTEDAIRLYRRCFWDRYDCVSFARPLGEMIFDQAVNGGAVAAIKCLQRALNHCTRPSQLMALKDDGKAGPATHRVLDYVLKRPALGMSVLIVAYRAAVSDRYRAIAKANPSQNRFLKGWLRRAADLGKGW